MNNSNKILQILSNFIIDQLQREKISLQLARELAKFFLALIPEEISDDEACKLLQKMDSEFFDLLKQQKFTQAQGYVQNNIKDGSYDN